MAPPKLAETGVKRLVRTVALPSFKEGERVPPNQAIAYCMRLRQTLE